MCGVKGGQCSRSSGPSSLEGGDPTCLPEPGRLLALARGHRVLLTTCWRGLGWGRSRPRFQRTQATSPPCGRGRNALPLVPPSPPAAGVHCLPCPSHRHPCRRAAWLQPPPPLLQQQRRPHPGPSAPGTQAGRRRRRRTGALQGTTARRSGQMLIALTIQGNHSSDARHLAACLQSTRLAPQPGSY